MLDAFDARYHRDSVISDGYYGMYTMVDYLLQMGHRDIVFVGSVNATSSITDRYYGYCRAMREASVTVTEDRILPDRDAEGKVTVSLERLSKLPTAFACNCDVTAYVLLNALKENGIRVPEDVSVVGFDDYILADLAVPSLTTYAIDVDHMAKVSAQQLIRRIQKPEAEVRRIVVSGKLVIRESVQNIQETLHKVRLTVLHAICLQIFRHIAQKSVEKSDYASYAQALFSVSLGTILLICQSDREDFSVGLIFLAKKIGNPESRYRIAQQIRRNVC